MSTWTLRGYDDVTRALDRQLATGRMSHAYLITGPRGVGKRTLALDMACAVNCSSADSPCGACPSCTRIHAGQHPDVMLVDAAHPLDPKEQEEVAAGRQRNAITIGDVRRMGYLASVQSYGGGWRVFILRDADRLRDEAANALLKVLEEPPERVLILLAADDESSVLPTVRSRCRRVELPPLGWRAVAAALRQATDMGEADAEALARQSGGRIGIALTLARDPDLRQRREEEAALLVDLMSRGVVERFDYAATLAQVHSRDRRAARERLARWADLWRDVCLIQQGVSEGVEHVSLADPLARVAGACSPAQALGAARAVLATVEALEQNANARLALEALMMRLPVAETAREGVG